MRIFNSCVNSVDIIHECGKATHLFSEQQLGIGIMIMNKDDHIGNIDYHAEYLGDDFLITKISIRDNEELSKKLTEKYRGKILIPSIYIDSVN
jgi:hypothetical protein